MSRFKELVKKYSPYINRLNNRINDLTVKNEDLLNENKDLVNYKTAVPPGHFYSPYPDITHVKNNEERIFRRMPKTIPGVDLKEKQQLELFKKFSEYYQEMPFKSKRQKNLRYWFENEAYQYSDAICLYSMIRHLKPRKIIEVGSGYSSCAILDTNELFFDNSIECIFIEPYPELLKSLLKGEDSNRVRIIPKNLQDVEIELFRSLESGDILFIDSTHVSKVDSDVNYILFEILPNLKPGVHIHFHDVIYPFEYWPSIFYSGVSWNEAYMLRAFLQYNNSFDIVFYNTYLEKLYPEKFRENMPLCMKHMGGSIWIKRV